MSGKRQSIGRQNITSENKTEKVVDNTQEKVLKPSLSKPSANTPSTTRKKRKPLHLQRRVYFQNSDPDFHYHIVNDKPGRVNSFEKAGYEIVEGVNEDQLKGTAASNQLGKTAAFDVGGGETAYRMRIPRKLWEEDNAARIEKTQEIDMEIEGKKASSLFKQTDGDSVQDSEKYYIKN